ncbi:MAG TPA: S8 family serine peptidase [Actinomycetes bacterium]|nr:S8 family serine peptidase [Actinomycetes bacterium]
MSTTRSVRGAALAVALVAVVAGTPRAAANPTPPSPPAPPPPVTAVTTSGDASGSVRLSVVTRAGADPFQVRRESLGVAGALGVSSRTDGQPYDRYFTLVVPRADVAATTAGLRLDPAVASVEPVHPMSLLDAPSDALFSQQEPYLSAIDVPRAWTVTHGSAAVRVAVIDSGVNTSHPDLAGKVVARYNAVTGGTNVTDKVGHGTMVASIIAADTDNGAGIAGVGWRTELMAVRVADSAGAIDDADVAVGVSWAVRHGAKVINLSLGGPAVGTALRTAIADAVASGVVVVAAAGNDGTTKRFYPAALPGVIAVGATTHDGKARASFSEHGSWVDVAAPGVGILGAARTGSGYDSGDGTSFAAPLVSGVAALIRASRPTLSVAGVGNALRTTASKDAHGFAHGDVDAYRALGYHLVLPGPTVTSPTPGATVGGDANVQVDVPSGDHVRAWLVGRPGTKAAAVSAASAALTLPAWGSAGSRTLRVVACRQTLCSSTGTDVPVTVDYPAPVLTAPSDGDHETATWTVSATSSAPAVRFLADASTVLATDTTAPFSASIPVGRLPSGSHVITAVACDAAGTTCDSSPASSSATVSVAHLTPTVTSLTPRVISPNADGTRDRTTLTYSLDEASDVTVSVVGPRATTIHTWSLGQLGPGRHRWIWDGTDGTGTVVASASYVIRLDTSSVSGEARTGTASASVRVDLVRPSLTSVATTYATVYPHHDGFRDSTVLSARLSESASVLMEVRNAAGARVWSATVSRTGPGAVRATWSGRSSGGHALPAGAYRFTLRATDLAGNTTTTPAHEVTVSLRAAAVRHWSETISAQSAGGGGYQSSDDASYAEVYPPFGSGALRLHASPSGAVRTVNRLGLPAAAEYRSLRLSAYGRGVGGGTAELAFLDDAGDEVGVTHLPASTGNHSGTAVRATPAVLDGHRARWELLVEDGDTYDVRDFTITLTYVVLV